MKCRDAEEAIQAIRDLEAELELHLAKKYPTGSTVYYEHGNRIRHGVVETHTGRDHGQVLIMRPSGSRKWCGVNSLLRYVKPALAAAEE